MQVKWRGLLSKVRALPGGGPQGGTLGIEEYLSQTNGNTDFLEDDEKYKFIDDLSILELLKNYRNISFLTEPPSISKSKFHIRGLHVIRFFKILFWSELV